MRHYQSMRVPPFVDKNLRGELRKVDQWIRMASTQFGRTVVQPQGTPSGSIGGSLGDYLYLPGRPNGQISYGRVLFQAKPLPSGLTSVPDTSQSGFGWQSVLARDGLTSLNIWLQSTNANNNPSATREWAFPAFNEVEGDTAGLHFFVDESNHQSLTLKTFRGCRYVAGLTSGEGWLDNSESRYFHWTLENQPGNRNATTHANIATRPILQIGPLDVQTGLGVSSYDNSHAVAVVRVPRGTGSLSTTTPFEIDGVLHGGDTQREVYCAPGSAKAGYAGPSAGSFLVWNPAIAFTGNTNSNTNINGMSTTVGMVAGMRIRDTRSTSAYVEYFIVSVNSAFDITVSEAFSDTTVGVSFVAFGITYQSVAGIDHGSLSGLTDDDHPQYLHLNGRTGGQSISQVATNFTGTPAINDVMMAGRLAIHAAGGGTPGFSMGTQRPLDVRYDGTVAITGATNFSYNPTNVSSASTHTAMQVLISGTLTAAGTHSLLRGINFTSTATVPNGTTLTECIGALFQSSSSTGAGGVISKQTAARFIALGDNAASTHANGVVGLEIQVNARQATTTLRHIALQQSAGGPTGAVADYWGIDFGSAANQNSAVVVNWTGIRIPDAPGNPTGTIRGLHIGDIWSHHHGPFRFGSTANPVHMADFAAGTTGQAPIKLTNGTNLTAAIAGCVEYDGTDLFFTHGDAVRTKVVTQRGQTNLTAQGAAIGATTIYTPAAAGYYVFHYTLETTTLDVTAGTIQVQVNYTDDVGATNQTGAALLLTATGRDRGAFEVWSASGVISYQTNLTGIIGTSQYALRIRLEYLG